MLGLFKKIGGGGPDSPSKESAQKTPSSPTQAKSNSSTPPPQQKNPATSNSVQRQGSSASNLQEEANGEEEEEEDLFGGMEVKDTEDSDAPVFTNPAKVTKSSATTSGDETPFFLRGAASEGEKGTKEDGEESMFEGMNLKAEKPGESNVSAFSFLSNGGKEEKQEKQEEEEDEDEGMFEGLKVKDAEESKEEGKEEKSQESAFSFLAETKSPAPPPKDDVDLLSSFEANLAVNDSSTNSSSQTKDYLAELQDANISLDVVAVTPVDEQERKAQLAKRAGGKSKKKTGTLGFQEAESPKQASSNSNAESHSSLNTVPEVDQPKDVTKALDTVMVAAQEKPLPQPPKEVDPSPAKKEDKPSTSPAPKDELLTTPLVEKIPEEKTTTVGESKRPAVVEDKSPVAVKDQKQPENPKREPAVEDLKKEPAKEEPKKASIAATSPTPSSAPSSVSMEGNAKKESEAVVDIAGRLKKIEEEEQNLLKKLTSAHTQVIQFWHSVRDTEAKQLEASEKEDFELAAQLDMSLVQTQQEIHACERQVEEINAALSDIYDRKTALVRSGLTSRNELIAKLTKTASDEEKAFKTKEDATATEHKREGLRLDMESDRIERERSHVKLERELVEKAKVQLQEKISKEGKEFLDKRDQATAQKQRVSEKIEELMAQLEQLRKEEQECTQAIENADGEIKKIASLFSEEEKQIESDQKGVDQKESEFQSKLDSIQVSQAKLKETVKLFDTVRIEHLKKMGDLEGQLIEHTDISRNLQLRLDLTQQVYRRMTVGLKRGEAPELDRKRQAREDKEEQVKHLAEEEEKLQKAVSDIRRSISASEEKLPELEKQKKLAVSTKNFKEASRVTADIKTITSEKEGMEEKLKSLQQAHSAKEQDVIEARNEYRELSEAFDKLEHDHDLSVLEKYERILESSKEEHARVSLLDLPDVENVSATSLKTLASAILQLKVKHSLFSDAKIQSEKGIRELVDKLSTDGVQELKNKLKAEAAAAEPSGQDGPEESAVISPPDSVKDQEGDGGDEEGEEEEEGDEEEEKEEEKDQEDELALKSEDLPARDDEDAKAGADVQQPESPKGEEEAENEKEPEENIEELKEQVAALEASLEKAVENEDFELADTLDQQIEELKAKIPEDE